MRITVERTVSRDPVAVFAFFTSAQAYTAAHPATCRSLTYTARTATSAIVDEEWTYLGRVYRMRHRVRTRAPRRLAFETIQGFGRGARETLLIDPAGRGSRVRYEVSFTLTGPVQKLLAAVLAARVRRIVEELADEDMRALELAGGELREEVARPARGRDWHHPAPGAVAPDVGGPLRSTLLTDEPGAHERRGGEGSMEEDQRRKQTRRKKAPREPAQPRTDSEAAGGQYWQAVGSTRAAIKRKKRA